MNSAHNKKRRLIEGRPALIVINIQTETFCDRTDEAIPTMSGYADRMTKARVAIDKAHEASLRAMEYLQTGARCTLDRVLSAMEQFNSDRVDTAWRMLTARPKYSQRGVI
jgi:hypothetical protein